MNRLEHKAQNQKLRAARVRAVVSGTKERPRLSVKISNRHVSAQVINDADGKTLASASSVGLKAAKGSLSEIAALVGAEIAKKAVKAKVSKVSLDRAGRAYQKRLSAFADAARENGLEF